MNASQPVLLDLRSDFHLDDGVHYFNSASCAPPPVVVADTMNDYYRDTPLNYRSGATPLEAAVTARVDAVRKQVANMLSADLPQEVVFTKNTTEGVNTVAEGVRWSEGDEVLITPLEHQSNLLAWLRLIERRGVTVRYIRPASPSGVIDPEDVRKMITPRTKLISMHHISNVLGCIQDISAISTIARDRGVLTMVDAAQSEGRIEVNVRDLGCDLLVSCARKALLGPQGVGFLWGRAEVLESLDPLLVGGQSYDLIDDFTFEPKELPYRYESGIVNTAGIIGLGAALRFRDEVGPQAISAHIQTLTQELLAGLAENPRVRVHSDPAQSLQSGITSFSVDGTDPQRVAADMFNSGGVVTAAGLHGSPLAMKFLGVNGVIRMSVHCYNSMEDVDTAVHTIASVTARG